MHNKMLLIGVIGIVVGVLLSTTVALAGSLNPNGGPGAPAAQMYTLEQIYQRLTTGAFFTKQSGFTEPDRGTRISNTATITSSNDTTAANNSSSTGASTTMPNHGTPPSKACMAPIDLREAISAKKENNRKRANIKQPNQNNPVGCNTP